MKKFLSGLGLIAIAASLATASAGELISGTTTAQCYNCGKKAVDLGQWDNCALASVAQGGANSSCAVGRYSDGWALSVVDPKADAKADAKAKKKAEEEEAAKKNEEDGLK